jgi:hypothetical protein
MKEFTASTKIQFSHQNRQPTYFLQLSDDSEFNQGCIELQWWGPLTAQSSVQR